MTEDYVSFTFIKRPTYQMEHIGSHTHKIYKQKHLNQVKKDAEDEVVESDSLFTSKVATVGILARIVDFMEHQDRKLTF